MENNDKKTWDEAHEKNKEAIRKARKARKRSLRSIHDEVAKAHGMVKVRGAVSGQIYYE